MGEYSRAISDFNQALHHLPDYANAYHNRAVALKASGNPGAAEADLKKERDVLATKIPLH
jgi:tetratricopeptide (TPR) repeat protein